jgi:pimeloyl-ACP methyl ester carboxylesterase
MATLVMAAGCSAREGLVGSGQVPTTAAPSTTAPTTAPPAPGSTVAPAPAPGGTTITWTPCGQLECAKLPVPLDHDQPGGRKIEIALSRKRATDQSRRIGSLLVNPGGPGVSGIEKLPFILGRISAGVRARFDVIGFDPRGTGGSAPIRCLPAAELDKYFAADAVPDDEAEKAALVEVVRRFTAGCQKLSGDLLPHVGTEDAVRDMDLIRAAVGDDKLTYVGFSYGTALGATYAEQFPTRVRALVLDGGIDPSLDMMGLNRVQGEGFDRAFDAFAADCRGRSSCEWKPAGGASKQAFLALSARVDASPLPAGARRAGPSELFLGTAAFLYSRQSWNDLAKTLAQAEAGNGTFVLAGFDSLVGRNRNGTYKNEQEANAAINCVDNPAPKDVAAYERAAAEAARTAPAFGPAISWSGLVCGLWPVPATGKAEPLKAPGSPPILVIGTTNDPATPFVWSEALAAQLPQGRLLRHEGEGHTAYGEDACTTRITDAYLLTLVLPSGAIRC